MPKLPFDPANLTFINKLKSFAEAGPVLLECFATWCAPCRAQIPHVSELAKSNPGLTVLAVATEDPATVQKFFERIPHMKDYNVACDTGAEVAKFMGANGIESIPHAVLFNRQGDIAYSGSPADHLLETAIAQAVRP